MWRRSPSGLHRNPLPLNHPVQSNKDWELVKWIETIIIFALLADGRHHLHVSVRPIVHCSWIVLSLNYRENQMEAIFESTSLEPTVTLRSGFQLGAHETQMKCHFQINLHSESSWWIQTWQQSHQIFSAHLKVNSASSSQWELTSHQVPVLWWRGHRDNLRFFPECE